MNWSQQAWETSSLAAGNTSRIQTWWNGYDCALRSMSSAQKATMVPRGSATRIIRSSPPRIFTWELKEHLSRLCPSSCDAFEILQPCPAPKTGQNNAANTTTHQE